MPSFSSPHRTITTIQNKSQKRRCIVQTVTNLCLQGKLKEAVDSLHHLSRQGLRLDSRTLALILKQCGNLKSLKQGKWVHLHLKLTGFKHPNTFLSNHLIEMYSRCGSDVNARHVFDKMGVKNLFSWNNMLSGYAKMGMVKPARRLFDEMPERDVVSWNTMVIMYAKNGFCEEALWFYTHLRRLEIGVNQFSFAGVLNVCVKLEKIGLTRQVHGHVLVAGFCSNMVLASSILDAYSKCGVISDARKLFDEMPERDVLTWTTLVSGYAKWGDVESARRLFDEMPEKNPVSWTALIGGYVRSGIGYEALKLFTEMLIRGIRPDQFTFSSSLCACASIASLKHGKQIHGHLVRTGFKPNTIVVSSLIDMYSKCGRVETAKHVFDSVSRHDVSVWNAMITALAIHGLASEVMMVFSRMKDECVSPDSITFVGILTACSHCGLVEEGKQYFHSMRSHCSIEPQLEHYGAMVDLLGRVGLVEEAYKMIKAMPMEPDVIIWRSLLSACRIHRMPDFGEIAIEKMARAGSGDYVLLSNIYSSAKKWDNAEEVWELMKRKGIRKNRGLSWIEMRGVIHQFKAGDQSHYECDAIYKVLEGLSTRIKVDGFVPTTEMVFMDVTEEEKEGNLNCHSEKLATAYGILKTTPGTEIRVSKNLRTCYDCHNWMKIVSSVLNRVIAMRDRIRFHRFESGLCPCRDYW